MEANNSMAMREALEAARPILANCVFTHYNTVSVDEVVRLVDAALAKLPRNCDVGTAEEQAKRFNDYCKKQGDGCCIGKGKGPCPMFKGYRVDCGLVWAQMPYEKGEADGSK